MLNYRVEWFEPVYTPEVREVDLLFFTSHNGFTAQEASAIAEMEIGDEIPFDYWSVRIVRTS